MSKPTDEFYFERKIAELEAVIYQQDRKIFKLRSVAYMAMMLCQVLTKHRPLLNTIVDAVDFLYEQAKEVTDEKV